MDLAKYTDGDLYRELRARKRVLTVYTTETTDFHHLNLLRTEGDMLIYKDQVRKQLARAIGQQLLIDRVIEVTERYQSAPRAHEMRLSVEVVNGVPNI